MADISKFYHQSFEDNKFIASNKTGPQFFPKNSEPEPEIIQLCEDLNMLRKIQSFENGFDYVVGENGNKLSGGERQRLNLIRCFLKEADVYIFDEPYNFLDSFNKQKVNKKFEELIHKGKTVIIISHFLDDDSVYDKILFFKG